MSDPRPSTSNERLLEVLAQAKDLADQLKTDILQASTRIEHIRLTSRANEAALLLQDLENLFFSDTEN